MAKEFWQEDALAPADGEFWKADRNAAQRDLPQGVAPSTAGAGRGTATLADYHRPDVQPARAPRARAEDAATDEFAGLTMGMAGGSAPSRPGFTSVLESEGMGHVRPVQERLGLGAGPISQNTAVRAEQLVDGVDPGPDNMATVARAAQGIREQKAAGLRNSFGDLVEVATREQRLEEGMDRARSEGRRRFARDNPIVSSVASGAANLVAGAINTPQVLADAFNKTAVDPVLAAMGADAVPSPGRMPGTDTLERMGADFAPRVGQQPMSQALDRGEFGPWLMANLAQQSPQIAQSLIAAFAPPLRAVLLPGMGAQSAGMSYVGGDDSRVALTKGAIEIGTEMLPLQVFDRVKDSLLRLPAATQRQVLADAGRRLMAAGGALSANMLTNAVEESLAQFGGNVVDRYAAGEDVSLGDRVPDAAVLGAVAGNATGLPQAAMALRGPARELAPPPDRTEQIKALREAGDTTAADLLQRRQDRDGAMFEAQREAEALIDFGPDVQARYRDIRSTGAKPGDAVVQTAVQTTFEQAATAAGLSPKAAIAALEKASTLEPDKVPGFLQRALQGFVARGLAQPTDQVETLAQTIEQQRDQLLDAVLSGTAKPTQVAPIEPDSVAVAAGETAQAAPIETAPGNAEVDLAAHDAATSPLNSLPEPTQAQKEAGNYKVGRTRIAGMDISIENPMGSVRRGVDPDGQPWETEMLAHYGYLRRTEGADGDQLDVFIKSGTPSDYNGPVFVVDQIDPGTGKFDEAKIVFGAQDAAEAEAIYRSNYADDWQGLGAITPMEMDAFKAWAMSGDTKKPLAQLPVVTSDVQDPAPTAAGAEAEEAAAPAQPQATAVESTATSADLPGAGTAAPQTAGVATKPGSRARSRAWEANPLRAFIAEHGIHSDLANEFAPGVTERRKAMVPGFGPIFRRGGKNLDMLAEAAREAGFIQSEDTAELHGLIQRVFRGERVAPLFTEGAAEREMKAQAQARFEDYLAQQAEATEDDPFSPIGDYTDVELQAAGVSELSPQQRAELAALLAAAEDEGVDVESIQERVALQRPEATEQEYRDAVTAEITQQRSVRRGGPEPAERSSAEQGRPQAGSEGDAGGQQTAGQPGTPGEQSAQGRVSTELRADGTLAVKGDIPSIRAQLQAAGITNLLPMAGGVLVGKTRASEAQKLFTPLELAAPTRQDIEEQQTRAARAEKADAQEQRQRQERARADAERDEFTLTGSDRPADVAMAAGQGGLFDAPARNLEPVAAKRVPKPSKPVAPETPATIQDAGQKIGGARKDRWKERGLDLSDLESMSEAEGAELATKANVWKPDYEALASQSDPVSAATVKVIYDRLAAQPKDNTPAGRRRFVEMMQAVRRVYGGLTAPEQLKEARNQLVYGELRWTEGRYGDNAWAARNAQGVEDLAAHLREAKAKLFSVYKGRSDPFAVDFNDLQRVKKLVADGFPAKGEPWKSRLVVGRREGGPGTTPRGVELFVEQSQTLGTPVTADQVLAGVHRIFDKKGKVVAFALTREDAEATARTLYERDFKGGKEGKPEPERPHLDDVRREGLPQRIDRPVTSEDFIKDFGFRGVEFGNWSAQDERQRILVLAYDGLMDLAEIMGVPPKALSLNGTMGMAFGARGGGRFAAHYEPGKLVINMTKLRGAGSLAHEWAHAMDHYFGEFDRKDAYTTGARGASGWTTEGQYQGLPQRRMEMVDGKWVRRDVVRLDNLRPELAQAFDEVMLALFQKQVTKAEMIREHELGVERAERLAQEEQDRDLREVYRRRAVGLQEVLEALRKDPDDKLYAGRGRTDYATNAQKLSGKSSNGYWTRPTEMFARAFESWVFDRVAAMGARSDYLVHGVEAERFAGGNYKGNPYPTGEERARINAAFEKLAATIKTREGDDGNVAMFARDPGYDAAVDAAVAAAMKGERPARLNVVVGTTSDALVAAGVPRGDLQTSPSVLAKVVFDHGVTKATLKKIPDLLESPVMVFDSETVAGSFVVVTSEMVNGKPLLVVVTPEEARGGVKFNFMPSVYPKDRVDSIQRWLKTGKLRYIDQKQSPLWLGSSRLQLPAEFRSTKGLQAANVATEADVVKSSPDALSRPMAAVSGAGGTGDGVSKVVDAELFRRMTAPMARGMSVADVRAAVADIAKDWKNGPTILVVPTPKDLPVAAPSDARGMYLKGKAYIVASNHRSAGMVQRTLAHEAIAHHGLKEMLGEIEWKRMLKQMQLAIASGNTALRALRDDVRAAYVDENGNFNLSPDREADEIAARAVEQGVDLDTGEFKVGFGWLKQAYARFAQFLRRIGLSVTFTNVELQGLLSLAKGYLIAGASQAVVRGDMSADLAMARSNPALSTAAASADAIPVQPTLPGIATEPTTAPADPPQETLARRAQRIVQDQFNRFTVIRNWAKDQGMNLSQLSNVWEFEERMHGRIATRIEDFREQTVKPLIQRIQAAGFTMDQVAEFLHAQHAQERNEQIQRIDPSVKDGSGMTTADAQSLLEAADPDLVKLANEFRAITDSTRKVLLDAGIISTDMVDAWTGAYKHYVPLKGGDDGPAGGTGKGLSVNTKFKRAMGHGARSEHIIENIMRDHERAVMLAEKNLVGHSLLAMVVELGREDIATFGEPQKRKVLRQSTSYEVVGRNGAVVGTFDSNAAANRFIATQDRSGLIVRPVKGDPMVAYVASPMLDENEVQIYLRGQTVRVQLNDPLLSRSYKRMGVEHLNRILMVNREINSFLSKAYTGFNPEFFFVNVQRDLTAGLINITGREGAGMAAKALLNYPRAFTDMLRYSFTNGASASPSIQAYRKAGGSTGAAYLSDIERIGADIQGAYDEYRGVLALARDKNFAGAARAAGRKLLRFVTAWMEHLNAAGENAMRVAVFEAVRQSPGRSVQDAASAAKNATVNFNRKGELGAHMGALYLFFNAATQGTAATLDALFMGKHRHQAQVLAGAIAVLAYSLAAMQFGGDDDEAWEKVPGHVKDRNLVIRTGEDSYITLAVPYGYGYFFALGNALFDLQRGADKDKVALNLASGLLEHFGPAINPLGGDKAEAAGLIELMPGAVGGEMMRAAGRLLVNRSGLGGEIVPDSKFDEDRPDSQRMWRSSKGTAYEAAASTLNQLTGGTKSQAGGIDVSPETLKFWTETVTGGAGRFVMDAGNFVKLMAQRSVESDPKLQEALTPELREVPLARKLARKEDVRDSRRVFWEHVRDVQQAQAALKRAEKLGDTQGLERVAEDNAHLLALAKTVESTAKMVTRLRDAQDEINANEDYSLGEKRMLSKELERGEREVYDSMIQVFVEQKATAAR